MYNIMAPKMVCTFNLGLTFDVLNLIILIFTQLMLFYIIWQKERLNNGIFMVYMYNITYFSFKIALLFVFH
jgi:hypothetical protein